METCRKMYSYKPFEYKHSIIKSGLLLLMDFVVSKSLLSLYCKLHYNAGLILNTSFASIDQEIMKLYPTEWTYPQNMIN